MMLRMAKSRGSRSRWNAWSVAGIAIVTAVVVFAGYAGYVSLTAPDEPDYVSTYTPPPNGGQVEYLPVSILGDSYTAGSGAEKGRSWANEITRRMCWKTNINGQAGSGYVAQGARPEYTPFPDRVAAVTDNGPALILVQGSTNDAGRPAVQETAARTYADLRARAPQARIVVIGPTAAPSTKPETLLPVRDALRAATAEAGVDFIDPIELGWLPNPGSYNEQDRLHPTTLGAAEYATNTKAMLESMAIPNIGCDRAAPPAA